MPAARGAAPPGPVSSDTEPQVWHSPHRPTHLDVVQPHSVQRNAGRAVREEVVVDTAVTLTGATDTRGARTVTASQRPRGAHRTRSVTGGP